MTTWLLKTEPDVYSYDDLVRKKRTAWDGVTNPAAQKHMRDMRQGDEAFIYHTGDERRLVGLAKIVQAPYPDPAAKGATTANGDPKLVLIDLAPVRAAKTPVTLAQVKADERFGAFALVRQARLSVMPVPGDLEKILRQWSGL